MSEWVDLSVYATLNVTMWFLLPAWAGRLTTLYMADRNAEWVHTHAEQARRLSSTVALRLVCSVFGVLSIALLLLFQLDVWPEAFVIFSRDSTRWEALKDLNSTLFIPGGVALMVLAALSAGRVDRIVPPANRRLAALVPRTLNDFVPRSWQRLVYGLNGLTVAAWAAVAATHAYSTPQFWARFAFLVFMCGVFALFVRISVRRPPHVMDRLFGPGFRAGEVRFAFAQQLLPAITGSWRLYEEVANVTFVDVSRAMHLGVAMLVVSWAWRLMMYPSGKSFHGNTHTDATLRWSTP